jgi:L,D-transpeptidase YcbB
MSGNLRGILSLAAWTAGLIAVLTAHIAKDPGLARYDRLAPIATLAPADAAIAEKLRDVVAERFADFFAAPDRPGVAVFYRLRSFAPLWIENAAPSPRANAATDYLGTVDSEGLDPGDYRAAAIPAAGDPKALAEEELRFTATILKYVHDAENGRVAFSRVSADVDYARKVVNARAVLADIAGKVEVAKVLAAFNPSQQGYRALRAKLADLRGRKLDDEDSGHAVPTEGPLAAAARPDRRSIDPPSVFDREDIVVANMERWRWMPRDLGSDYVIVNIPNFSLTLLREHSAYFRTNVVVGAPDLPTPLISATMKSITINPVWNVPQSIAEDEYLPALARDPDLAAQMGLRIETKTNGQIRVYQPPGDFNVLGRIRFNFPNKFLVFQHDTDDTGLFGLEVRASSHGCMRVENPFSYATALLSIVAPDAGYSEQRLRALIGDSEVEINFSKPIPVHLTYQTAIVDSSGDLVFKRDIYGLDARLIAALKRSHLALTRDRRGR